MSPLDRYLWFSTAALSAAVLGKLIYLHLWTGSSLRSFALMLLVSLTRDVTLSAVPYTSHSYAVVWEAFIPLLLVSHAWCAFAAYRAVVSLYPNIGRFATWLFAGSLAVAALLCLGTLPWELQRIGHGNESFIRSMFLLYRWVDGLSAGGLILACGFLMKFPRPMKRMPRNLLWHTSLLTAYFSSGCVLFFAENLTGHLGQAVLIEHVTFGLVALLYAAWILALSRKGEQSEPWEELEPAVTAAIAKRTDFGIELARSVLQNAQ